MTVVPLACSVVFVSLASLVSVQPSTVISEPSSVFAATQMESLSGLNMSTAPPSTGFGSKLMLTVVSAVMSATAPNFLKALGAFCFELLFFIVIILHKDMS